MFSGLFAGLSLGSGYKTVAKLRYIPIPHLLMLVLILNPSEILSLNPGPSRPQSLVRSKSTLRERPRRATEPGFRGFGVWQL